IEEILILQTKSSLKLNDATILQIINIVYIQQINIFPIIWVPIFQTYCLFESSFSFVYSFNKRADFKCIKFFSSYQNKGFRS
ncbi:hypothetical protein pb186bvf_021196, partial [Paramecium bursaria]